MRGGPQAGLCHAFLVVVIVLGDYAVELLLLAALGRVLMSYES